MLRARFYVLLGILCGFPLSSVKAEPAFDLGIPDIPELPLPPPSPVPPIPKASPGIPSSGGNPGAWAGIPRNGGGKGVGGPARGRGAGSMGVRRGRRDSHGVATWRRWWDLNRDAFVNLRESYHRALPRTGAHKDTVIRPYRPTRLEVASELMPVFKELDGKDDVVTIASLLAMARCANPAQAQDVVERLERYLGDRGRVYREDAILALGLTAHPRAQKILISIVADRAAGRRTLRQSSSLPDGLRAYAAYALSQLPSEKSYETLRQVAENRKTGAEVRVACVTAMGLLSSHDSLREPMTRYLVRSLRADWHRNTLAHVPSSLARTDDPIALSEIARLCRQRGVANSLRQSAALAYGRGLSTLDNASYKSLVTLAREDSDASTRGFAIISLGEACVNAANSPTGLSDARIASLQKLYTHSLQGQGVQAIDRPWYAMSAALFAQSHPEAAEGVIEELRRLLQTAKSDQLQAACALALGISKHRDSVEDLREIVDEGKSILVAGYAAEALGLLRDRDSLTRLMELDKRTPDEWLRYRAAIALGFLGLPKTLNTMGKALRETNSDAVRAALTRALGEIGDRRSMPLLIEIAQDTSQTSRVRARAVSALGFLGREEDSSWTSTLRRGCNYAASTPSLDRVLRMN